MRRKMSKLQYVKLLLQVEKKEEFIESLKFWHFWYSEKVAITYKSEVQQTNAKR